MMPTSVVQQTFWDRIPNATSKLAILGRSDFTKKTGSGKNACNGTFEAADVPVARINKRKQSHPMRSPLSPSTSTDSCPKTHDASAKVRCISLDQHLPETRALHAVDTPNLSRAFCLSFSDDYSRNPHQYVQALIDSESMLTVTTAPLSKSHSSRVRQGSTGRGNTNRGRETHSGGRANAKQGGGSKRNRAARFHNLQLEQTISAAQSENEDANSITTVTSDLNELADIDNQVPSTPVSSQHRLAAKTESFVDLGPTDDSDASKLPTPQLMLPLSPKTATSHISSHSDENNNSKSGSINDPALYTDHSTPTQHAADHSDFAEDDGDIAEPAVAESAVAESAVAESAVGTPASLHSSIAPTPTPPPQPPHELGEDNMPSYQRLGQELTDDVSLIIPPSAKSTVKWAKAEPIDIADRPLADKLASAERHCCSVLRILPEQYVAIKQTLLREGCSRLPGTFKKRDAQRLCRIDVNKTSKIYEWFVTIGWLPAGNGVYTRP
ncbi:hypothetical protein GGF37_003135 [Kickxella alabastrina]|nr:hypothetical protein GGF37_003135 [Kickxella alabastrina]